MCLLLLLFNVLINNYLLRKLCYRIQQYVTEVIVFFFKFRNVSQNVNQSNDITRQAASCELAVNTVFAKLKGIQFYKYNSLSAFINSRPATRIRSNRHTSVYETEPSNAAFMTYCYCLRCLR